MNLNYTLSVSILYCVHKEKIFYYYIKSLLVLSVRYNNISIEIILISRLIN